MSLSDVLLKSHLTIDNFLPEDEFKLLRDDICFNNQFPVHLHKYVTYKDNEDEEEQIWNWYGTHIFYEKGVVNSSYFNSVRDIFIPRFTKMGIFNHLIRIKSNFYPHTESIKEHIPHQDYKYSHIAALYSLNTCDGFTRMEDGSKIDSVGNRLLLFNGSKIHNSSTTTNSSIRFNINFNFK
jgi:hypothetical protein